MNQNIVPPPKHRIIIIVAECIAGALEAGRFAVRNLLDADSKLLLLQTYQNPKYGQSQLRSLSPMLHRIAMEDLSTIKNSLIEEFNLSADSIFMEAIEDTLLKVLSSDFGNRPENSVVIGISPKISKGSLACKSVIKSVVDSGIRPIIIVSDSITLIDSETMILYSPESEPSNGILQQYIEQVRIKNKLIKQHRTAQNPIILSPDSETIRHFSAVNGTAPTGISESESLLRKDLQQFETEKY